MKNGLNKIGWLGLGITLSLFITEQKIEAVKINPADSLLDYLDKKEKGKVKSLNYYYIPLGIMSFILIIQGK